MPTPKIYTKTGDAGDTSLFDNSRVSKADPRVDAYGEVDEVNACLAPDDSIAEGKESALDEALGRYRQVMEELTGTVVARLDMLLKAVPAVAERVRRSGDAPAAVSPDGG